MARLLSRHGWRVCCGMCPSADMAGPPTLRGAHTWHGMGRHALPHAYARWTAPTRHAQRTPCGCGHHVHTRMHKWSPHHISISPRTDSTGPGHSALHGYMLGIWQACLFHSKTLLYSWL
uniref:Uncharacterized protein n=1 Tax=Arundo donax TaxID=35708 RepID=A0A0A8XNR4_ARUDO